MINYTDEFNLLWAEYPKRTGNPKAAAYSQYKARIKAGYKDSDIIEGTKRYKQFCIATGKMGTEFIMQAKKFYGRDEWFLEDWEIPTIEVKESLSDKANRLNIQPNRGESQQAYDNRVRAARG